MKFEEGVVKGWEWEIGWDMIKDSEWRKLSYLIMFRLLDKWVAHT